MFGSGGVFGPGIDGCVAANFAGGRQAIEPGVGRRGAQPADTFADYLVDCIAKPMWLT
jgi:hypothetical protein